MKYKIILPSIYFDSEGLAVATDCYLVGPNGTLNAPYRNLSRSKRKERTEELENVRKKPVQHKVSLELKRSAMVSLVNGVSINEQAEKERIQFTDNGVIATEEYKTLIFHPIYLKVNKTLIFHPVYLKANKKFIYFALSDRNEVSVNEFKTARKYNDGYAVEYDVRKDNNASAVEYGFLSTKQTKMEAMAYKSVTEIRVSDTLPLNKISSKEIFRGVGCVQTGNGKVMRSEIGNFTTKDIHYSSITQTIPLSQGKLGLEAIPTNILQQLRVNDRVDKTFNGNTISVNSNTNKQEMEHKDTLQVVSNQTELQDKEEYTNITFDVLTEGDKILDNHYNQIVIEKHKLLKTADNIQEAEDDEDDIFNEIMVTHQKHLLRYKQLLKAENSPFLNELPRDNVRSENEFGRVEKDTKTRTVHDFGNKTSEVNTQHKIIKPNGTVLQRITKVHRKRLSGYREIESLEISLIENKLKEICFNFFRKFKLRKKLRFHQKKLKVIEYFEEKFIVEELLRDNARSENEFLNI